MPRTGEGDWGVPIHIYIFGIAVELSHVDDHVPGSSVPGRSSRVGWMQRSIGREGWSAAETAIYAGRYEWLSIVN